jgi:hypothetical protein
VAFVVDDTPVLEGNFTLNDTGPLHLCFLKAHGLDCHDEIEQQSSHRIEDAPVPFEVLQTQIVRSPRDGIGPMLMVRTCGLTAFNGDCGVVTTLYRYDKARDQFALIFENVTWRNQNQETRFIEAGPLRGAMIAATPGSNQPYTYWVDVYRQEESGAYARALRYRGKTRYADGNPLAVIDSEMPEILRRLGKWKQGDPLPVPPQLPDRCTSIYLEGTVEWCR